LNKEVYAQDIALHKKYVLSPLPNYSKRTSGAIDTTLTDGIYSHGTYFWSQPTTLGWVKTPGVKITLDLGRVNTISGVTFNTCRRVDSLFNVRYPDHIFIFLSNDNVTWWYAGDAAIDSGNRPGPYQIKKFILNSINQTARYISLSVVPNGFFVLCDEITVMQGNSVNSHHNNPFDSTMMNEIVDSLISINFYKNHLLRLNNYALKSASADSRKKLVRNISKLTSNQISLKNLKSVDSITKAIYLKKLRQQFKTGFIIEKVSPWDSIPDFYVPTRDQMDLKYQFLIPNGGRQYGAFIITNLTTVRENFSFNSVLSSDVTINLFDAIFVPASNYKFIPDALIPIPQKGISVDAGNSVLLIFQLCANAPGDIKSSLSISSSNILKKISIEAHVPDFKNYNKYYLNTNVWFNNYHPMVVDRQVTAFTDLKNHHINTMIIGPGYLSPLNIPDFPNLPGFLSYCKYATNLLISTDFSNIKLRQPEDNVPFMSDAWKIDFVKWYKSLLAIIKNNGFSISNTYFYPYDEVRGGNVYDYINFARWAKSFVPDLKLYATLTSSIIGKRKQFDELLRLLDIAQIGTSDPIVLPKLPYEHPEIWVYENNGNSRSQSPYSHYRLMAWDAFINNITGIGFWSYTGDARKKFVSDPFTDIDMDYGVIYDGPRESIISSRRWEAFSLGIEDYQILDLFANKYGRPRAIVLAKEVVSHPSNVEVADEIRNKMILFLEKK